MIEGNSLMLTLIKNYSDEAKTQKKINVKKIISLKELINKPIKNITFKFKKIEDIQMLKNLSNKNAETVVKIIVEEEDKLQIFQLKDKRKINNQLINSLNLYKNIVVD